MRLNPALLALLSILPTIAATATAQQAPPTSVPAASETAEDVSEADMVAALQRHQREPSVDAVIEAAIRHQRADPRRVMALASDARLSGWLPTIRLSARRGQTIDLLAAQTTTTDRNSASSGDDLVLEAQLMFDLGRVVWSREELRVEREMRAERQAQQELIRTVSALYFERRRAQVAHDLADAPDLENTLRIAEIEGVLDALTGGAFGRLLSAAAHATSPADNARGARH